MSNKKLYNKTEEKKAKEKVLLKENFLAENYQKGDESLFEKK